MKPEKECFIGYLNTEKRVEKTRLKAEFFKQFRGVWISDETLFRVFDIASQRNQYFKRYLGSKLAKFYAN